MVNGASPVRRPSTQPQFPLGENRAVRDESAPEQCADALYVVHFGPAHNQLGAGRSITHWAN
jgi:hypothetical protein